MLAREISRATVLAALSRHVGRHFGVSIGQLTFEITGKPPEPHVERRVREHIEALRREGEHICAHPATGYYMAASAEELDDTCRFLFARAMTSLRQVAAMKRVALPDLAGQLRLKT